ncbi:MAG: FtsQ-type POTRA domain-containing protein [Gammaproteobacteria bacterium]|nr:FtsQ-type POTRA domain-containing protein [Gammaproteobacteria bacterium]MDH3856701.1 FtsQ-type POTRA domain-containing protein [Gammaproteobacteria bacterium]
MAKSRRQIKQAQRNTPASTSPSFQWRKSYNWIFLLLPLMLAVVYLIQVEEPLPIRTIQLSGTFENLDQQAVEMALQPYLGQGFFSLDIHHVKQTLHDRSWIESVSVRRIWPDKLRVNVKEKVPVARWDGQHLLSDSASVYRADTAAFSHLPVVHATNHPPAWVLKQFYHLEARFHSVDERLIALQVDSRGALDVELINGLEIKLGRRDIDHKIDRLVVIYPQQILPRREQIQRLDLRYSNGFAVAWKKEALQGSDKASIWSNGNV